MFKPMNEQTSLYKRIAEMIRGKIVQGELAPGQKLPPERELAEMLGVSRTSLREALKILNCLGIVDINHGQGVFITEIHPDDIVRKLVPKPKVMSRRQLDELFEIRRALEIMAVEAACEKITPAQVQSLKALIDEAFQLVEGWDTVTLDCLDDLNHIDDEFHNTIIAISGNSMLQLVIQSILELIQEGRRYSSIIPGRALRSLDDHKRIVEALASGDRQAALDAMNAHISGVRRSILVQEEGKKTRAQTSVRGADDPV